MSRYQSRAKADEIVEKRKSLLAILENCARDGQSCPTLPRLAILLRVSVDAVHAMFHSLRNARLIKWEIVFVAGGKARIVTITSSGAKTAKPGVAGKRRPPLTPAPGPVFTGPPVRTLAGTEFTKRKIELEARDLAERARAQI